MEILLASALTLCVTDDWWVLVTGVKDWFRSQRRYQVELKHGRVSMLACTGYIVPWRCNESGPYVVQGHEVSRFQLLLVSVYMLPYTCMLVSA